MSELVKRLRAKSDWPFWSPLADEAADRIEALEAALTASPQTLRLHLGEMTAQEMRTVRAAFSWALARAALKQD